MFRRIHPYDNQVVFAADEFAVLRDIEEQQKKENDFRGLTGPTGITGATGGQGPAGWNGSTGHRAIMPTFLGADDDDDSDEATRYGAGS